MRYLGTLVLFVCAFGVATVATADPIVDCSRRSLANAVDNVDKRCRHPLQTTTFGTYTCDATVLVRGTSGITCPH